MLAISIVILMLMRCGWLASEIDRGVFVSWPVIGVSIVRYLSLARASRACKPRCASLLVRWLMPLPLVRLWAPLLLPSRLVTCETKGSKTPLV